MQGNLSLPLCTTYRGQCVHIGASDSAVKSKHFSKKYLPGRSTIFLFCLHSCLFLPVDYCVLRLNVNFHRPAIVKDFFNFSSFLELTTTAHQGPPHDCHLPFTYDFSLRFSES